MTATVAPRINMRLSPRADALIRRAAETADTTVTDFVLSAAVLAAERTLADQRIWTLDAASWDAFCESLDTEPDPAAVAQLRALFARPQPDLSDLT